MGLTSFHCDAPIRRRQKRVTPDFELLEDAIELFEKGEHEASIARTLEHLLGEAPGDLREAPISFIQGSSRIHLGIVGDRLEITVALVRLTDTAKTTAALRYLLTRISGSGQLHQPRLRGDEVRLEYADKLSRMHPMKLLEALRRMPVEADEHDDWMADQFGVETLEREPIEALSEAELERASAIWVRHWSDVEELLKESQRKRSVFFLNELTAYALFHIQALLPLSGAVLSRLTESAITFNASDVDPSRREAALSKCAKEMKALGDDTLRACLGHAHHSISPLADGTKQILEHYFGESDYLRAIDQARSSGRHLDAALACFTTYYYLLGRFSFTEQIEAALWSGLAQASDKSLRESTSLLLANGREIYARLEASEGEDDDDGDPDSRHELEGAVEEEGGA
jgi:hypothetical protein